MTAAERLSGLLHGAGPLESPGVWDALSALVAEKAGFPCISVSGAAVTAGLLGLPDRSFLGLSDMTQVVERIVSVTRLPVLVDCEDGYGDVLHVDLDGAGDGAGRGGLYLPPGQVRVGGPVWAGGDGKAAGGGPRGLWGRASADGPYRRAGGPWD